MVKTISPGVHCNFHDLWRTQTFITESIKSFASHGSEETWWAMVHCRTDSTYTTQFACSGQGKPFSLQALKPGLEINSNESRNLHSVISRPGVGHPSHSVISYKNKNWNMLELKNSNFNMFFAIASMMRTCILRFFWSHLLHYFLVIFVLKHFHLLFFTNKVDTKIYERYNYPL